jgi:hypothetical protein
MGAQARRLIPYPLSIQESDLAPAGGAPAHADVTPSPGEPGSEKHNAGSSGAHPVQGTLLLFPVGTVYHGTGKQDCAGKVQRVLPRISRNQAEPERYWDCGLKPPALASPLPLKRRGLRQAVSVKLSGFSCTNGRVCAHGVYPRHFSLATGAHNGASGPCEAWPDCCSVSARRRATALLLQGLIAIRAAIRNVGQRMCR